MVFDAEVAEVASLRSIELSRRKGLDRIGVVAMLLAGLAVVVAAGASYSRAALTVGETG